MNYLVSYTLLKIILSFCFITDNLNYLQEELAKEIVIILSQGY